MTQRTSRRLLRPVLLAHHVFASKNGYQTVKVDPVLLGSLSRSSESPTRPWDTGWAEGWWLASGPPRGIPAPR